MSLGHSAVQTPTRDAVRQVSCDDAVWRLPGRRINLWRLEVVRILSIGITVAPLLSVPGCRRPATGRESRCQYHEQERIPFESVESAEAVISAEMCRLVTANLDSVQESTLSMTTRVTICRSGHIVTRCGPTSLLGSAICARTCPKSVPRTDDIFPPFPRTRHHR